MITSDATETSDTLPCVPHTPAGHYGVENQGDLTRHTVLPHSPDLTGQLAGELSPDYHVPLHLHSRSTHGSGSSQDETIERSSQESDTHHGPLTNLHADPTNSPLTTDLAIRPRGTRLQSTIADHLDIRQTQQGSRSRTTQKGKQRTPVTHSARRTGHVKTRKRVPQNMQTQWRVGAAPSVALAMSREEVEISKILSQATAFHTSMSEVFWAPRTRIEPFVFDLDSRIEVFRDSSVVAACLVAAGRSNSAQRCLDKVLPSMDDLLRDPHPSLYLILAELSLGLVKTPNDALREQITRYLAGRSLAILGSEHPISVLLTTRLPRSRKEALAERLWKIVLPILATTFGTQHYQFSTQVFCQARNLASSGRFEEAIRIIETLLDTWSQIYGGNSLIVCYTKIELANILIAAGMDMKAELVVSDALRTSDMIHAAELKNEDCPATEKRHREASIAFPKIAGLRTLGRLHGLRRNFGAATYHYSQAVVTGRSSLGEDSAAVELAQTDLDLARRLELQQSLQQLSHDDLPRLTNIIGSPIC